MRPGIWLNDELINAYVWLVNHRHASQLTTNPSEPKMLCLNSFFMTKLETDIENKEYSFTKLEKWIRR